MRPLFSARDRRTVTLGGVIIVVIALAGRVAPSAVTRLRDEAVSDDVIRLERSRALEELKSLPELRDSARARRLRLGEEFPTLLHGNGDAALVAALVAEINDDASENAVFVSSIEAHTDTTPRLPYTPVNARAEVIGDVRGIAGLLSMIESSDTRMRISELSLTQSEPAAAPRQVEFLHAVLSIQALGRALNRASPAPGHAPTAKVASVATQ